MAFKPVVLWTDALVYLLVAVVLIFVWHVRRNPHLLVPWRRVSHSASGMAALTVLMFFIVTGLLDTVHLRPAVGNANGGGEQTYSVEVLSLLDLIATPLRVRVEKTYSAPFAAHLYARETVELPDGRQTREFPRLKFGGAHLQDPDAQLITDVALRAGAGGGLALLVWCHVDAFRHLAWRYRNSVECGGYRAFADTIALRCLAGIVRELPHIRYRQGRTGCFLPVAQKHPHRTRDRNPDHVDDAPFCAASGYYSGLLPGVDR